MRRLMEVSNRGVLDLPATGMVTDRTTVENRSNGGTFAGERVGYYFDHASVPMSMSSGWGDPGHLRLGALPSVPGGAGGTVFWTSCAGLFTDGRNKEQAAEYMRLLTTDERFYRASIGNHADAVGLLHPYEATWEEWRSDPPGWLATWAITLKDQLSRSRAIPLYRVGPIHPHERSGVAQFAIGRPHWEAYLRGEEPDPRRALENAKEAVLAQSY